MKLYPTAFLLLAITLLFACNNAKQIPKQQLANTEIQPFDFERAAANYAEFCASCHGDQLEAFVNREWKFGKRDKDIFKAINVGYIDDGMPAYDTTFTDHEVNELVAYIREAMENGKPFASDLGRKPASESKSSGMKIRLETVIDGLTNPWGMTFLPGGDMLFTERSGELYRLSPTGEKQEVAGVPEVLAAGQGGLLDVELHPEFEANNWLYLSYSKPKSGSGKSMATTAVARAKLNGYQLNDVEVIFEALPYSKTRRHYGSRLEFDRDGYLFLSVGDRGNRDRNPQSLDNHCGKIHRIYDDGRIPEDNPFVNQAGAIPSIYSYGHRNPQGLSMNPETGVMWNHEHGPKGGDEVNIIAKGKNYGWPVISYGVNYSGTKFTDITEKEGMEQPALYWVPSIAPCGSTFVTGDRYPAWKGDFLAGSLRFDYVNRCIVEGNKIVGEEKLFENIGRVRAIEMGPDGYLYVSVEGPGIIYRVVPENS